MLTSSDNFVHGWESEGAAFAVFHEGRLVVDLWGGYADASAMRPFDRRSLVNVFSATKGLASLCVAKLVDGGHLQYDDLVVKYWPAFGQKGKDNVTVAMLLSHQAGLAAIDRAISTEDVRDERRLSKILEEQTPNWPPGRGVGYHAITHGWLVDQLVRRVDPKHRSVSQFYSDEIATDPSDKCYIGVPDGERRRVARMSSVSFLGNLWASLLVHWRVALLYIKLELFPSPLFRRVFHNPSWLLDAGGRNGFNNPDVQAMEIPAANGLCTARALAQPFSQLAIGELLSKRTVDMISRPIVEGEEEKVLGVHMTGGFGFFHRRAPKGGQWLVGHPGFGGQMVRADFKNKLSFAYVTNGLKGILGDTARPSIRLIQTLYDCLEK